MKILSMKEFLNKKRKMLEISTRKTICSNSQINSMIIMLICVFATFFLIILLILFIYAYLKRKKEINKMTIATKKDNCDNVSDTIKGQLVKI